LFDPFDGGSYDGEAVGHTNVTFHGEPDVKGYIQRKAFDALIPISAMMEVTLNCNLRCSHCYNFDRTTSPEWVTHRSPMSLDRKLMLLDELKDAGTLYLAFTGGEAFVSPELWPLVDRASALGFAITILSNGVKLDDPAVIERLATIPQFQGLDVSVYGGTPETSDAFTGVPGAFDRMVAGLKAAKNAGIRTQLKFVLTAGNAGEVPQMLALADTLGLHYTLDATITPRHDGDEGALHDRMSLDQLETLYRGPLAHLVGQPMAPTGDLFACACSRSNVAVNAYGDVQPCIAVPWFGGNIMEDSFANIWNRSDVFRAIRDYRLEDYPHCRECPYIASCKRSSGAAFLVSGTFTGIDPWVCGEAEILHRIHTERAESMSV
jgi:radical SAM protein with 4Fe4S-binding SPASM domain